jgi:hypothetical protein
MKADEDRVQSEEDFVMVDVQGSEPPIRLPVSKELLGQLEAWSEPLQVQAQMYRGRWSMVFRRVTQDG